MLKIFLYKTVWVVTYILGWPIIRLFYKVEIEVNPKAYNLKSPVIFISNHKSPFDPWLVNFALPFHLFLRLLPISIMGSKKFISTGLNIIGKMGIINIIYGAYGVISLPKTNERADKLDPFMKALKRGETVLLFPEGKIHKGKDLGNFRDGAALLHLYTGLPIFVASIKFEDHSWRKKCIVKFGDHFSFDKNSSASEITSVIKNEVEKLYYR